LARIGYFRDKSARWLLDDDIREREAWNIANKASELNYSVYNKPGK
jgi:hypothetical protein